MIQPLACALASKAIKDLPSRLRGPNDQGYWVEEPVKLLGAWQRRYHRFYSRTGTNLSVKGKQLPKMAALTVKSMNLAQFHTYIFEVNGSKVDKISEYVT